jgi:hypothetical protein
MKVKCIRNFLWNDILTVGKTYETDDSEDTEDEYWLEDDNEYFNPFPKELFELLD